MSWFSRKPTQEKQVEAAVKVASNLYFQTIPRAEDAPAPLEFGLPDSRYRYLIFCLSTMTTACASKMTAPDAVVNDCFRFLFTWATTEGSQEVFGGPVNPQDAATSGGIFLQEFLDTWSQCVELMKKGQHAETMELICSMIHTTESNKPAEPTDKQRLSPLALQIDCWFPSMQSAFVELVN
jgi:hypothetical protein